MSNPQLLPGGTIALMQDPASGLYYNAAILSAVPTVEALSLLTPKKPIKLATVRTVPKVSTRKTQGARCAAVVSKFIKDGDDLYMYNDLSANRHKRRVKFPYLDLDPVTFNKVRLALKKEFGWVLISVETCPHPTNSWRLGNYLAVKLSNTD